jgi:hypothetical protein
MAPNNVVRIALRVISEHGSILAALGPGVIHIAMGPLSPDLCRSLMKAMMRQDKALWPRLCLAVPTLQPLADCRLPVLASGRFSTKQSL